MTSAIGCGSEIAGEGHNLPGVLGRRSRASDTDASNTSAGRVRAPATISGFLMFAFVRRCLAGNHVRVKNRGESIRGNIAFA